MLGGEVCPCNVPPRPGLGGWVGTVTWAGERTLARLLRGF